jgi:hypothetical protein
MEWMEHTGWPAKLCSVIKATTENKADKPLYHLAKTGRREFKALYLDTMTVSQETLLDAILAR